LVLNQEMNIGQFVAAEIIILLVINSVEKLMRGLETIYDLLTSIEKLGQVLDKELEIQEGQTPFTMEMELNVELDHVSFSVKGSNKMIINDISLKILPKTTTLIVGPNSSGKSTLLRLISGLLTPTDGTIFVNDISLENIVPNHYRSFLGQSLTEESPFEGTILNNITFGDKNIQQKDLQWALEKAGLSQFVKEQPMGVNTFLYPEGQQIPYTISKKIVLARSIVRKPKLLILKDPLDQLDEPETIEIMDFLTDKDRPWALVVVSQDPNWLSRCKRKIVVEGGKIISEN
jgi:ABC-type bacteriocin/lantibiotic exporter with double-glycine peptidase domain